MIFQEAYDYLWAELAKSQDSKAVLRGKDYQAKRLKRALLAYQLRPFWLEANWNATGMVAGSVQSVQTVPQTPSPPQVASFSIVEPMILTSGSLRSSPIGGGATAWGLDIGSFDLFIERSTRNITAQIMQPPGLRDDFIFTQALLPLQVPPHLITGGNKATAGWYGAQWPLKFPVPIRFKESETLKITITALVAPTSGSQDYLQLNCTRFAEPATDDLTADLRETIKNNKFQRPVWLNMATPGFNSIRFPGTAAIQRTTAQTREAGEHLLVLGYSANYAIAQASAVGAQNPGGSSAEPLWRLQTSDGYSFSSSEINAQNFAFAGPDQFYREFDFPFLLLKGSSLAASFTSVFNVANAVEQSDNYVIFRCVTI